MVADDVMKNGRLIGCDQGMMKSDSTGSMRKDNTMKMDSTKTMEKSEHEKHHK